MKKALLALLLFTSFASFAQEASQDEKVKHSEIKINAFNLIVFKSVDFSYEYLIDSESSVGASILFNLQNNEDRDFEDGPVYNEKFAFTPYYRRYFSSKYAWGFFLEAFGMYNVQEDSNEYYNYDSNEYYYRDSGETSNNIAFGMAVGGKFVSKKGFLFELYGGVGRNISTSNNDIGTEFVPRLGTSLGWRF
ncbi:hypothetical protein DFQ10_101426 [Winogradskyella eximia]|mgnify:CR=1 FL=1|uniref:DUF3575 domain-containing protein n=1 Tax=Winogradskyella eximia TaxID=262006 RepID=A0A3D9HAY6_9FLAO|nr:DUF3575 domain-containing protein [Winogradskyella eximia]RED46655.1 hypothetical protein DFQ10_101426 [Winogradskyella eximia]|tara:strand:- start:20 stop:595 length:576 start_codon:yes stop_codon:yes gene_type:complete